MAKTKIMDTKLIKIYLDTQKTKVVETFDFENKKVKYSEKIKGWKIEKFKGDEEIVRSYILAKLVNDFGYRPENIELEKFYPSGRPKTTNPRIDILVKDEKGNPYLFMELKSPQDYEKDKDKNIDDQLFSLAGIEQSKYGTKIKYLVYYTIDVLEDSIKDKAIIIDYEKYSSFADWEKERNFTNELPERYGNITKKPGVEINKEIEKLVKQFYFNYGYTFAREEFFVKALPKFAEKVFGKDTNLEKEVRNFIDEYKLKQLGGFNATYGRLYNWLFDFAAVILGVDELDLRMGVACK